MSEVAVREIEPRTQYFNHLVAQEGPFTTFSNIYAERNLLTAPMLDARFDDRARAIYGGLDPKTVFFPKANWQPYERYDSQEVTAVADTLNEHGRQSLKAARVSFALRNVNWLGLASKADMAIIPAASRLPEGVVLDEQGSFVRHAGKDIGIVGPRQDNDPSITLAMGVADCLAIPVVDTKTQAFGFAHAGRPGTGLRTSEKAIHGLVEEFGSDPKDLIAHLGEGVCGACYSVNEEVFNQFSDDFGGKVELDKVIAQYPVAVQRLETTKGYRYAIDLYAFNKYLLAARNISEITVAVNCTSRATPDCVSLEGTAVPNEAHQAFFSHERAKGKTVGWQAAGGETLEFNTFHLTTPRNLAALTRPY